MESEPTTTLGIVTDTVTSDLGRVGCAIVGIYSCSPPPQEARVRRSIEVRMFFTS